jgi:hypothetical protein
MAFVGGKCVLDISLALDSLAAPGEPDNLVLCVPLVSYLSAYHRDIASHFLSMTPQLCESADDLELSFCSSHSNALIPWNVPVGVIRDLVSSGGGSPNRLNLVVRFRSSKRVGESIIDYKAPQLFGSLFLNQIKVALTMRGKGVSQFNILSKENVDALQMIASGVTNDEDILQTFHNSSRDVFPQSEADSLTGSGVAAVKVYVLGKDEVFSTVMSVPFLGSSGPSTVDDILSRYDLSGYCCLTHGITLKPDTPIEFLQHNCDFADGFVHLIAIRS